MFPAVRTHHFDGTYGDTSPGYLEEFDQAA
jgi:hypothetical protein